MWAYMHHLSPEERVLFLQRSKALLIESHLCEHAHEALPTLLEPSGI